MGKVILTIQRIYTSIMIGRKEGDMVTLKDVPAGKFIEAYAEFLKKSNKIELPSWVDLVKTGHYHELAPYDDDWFYTRAAAIIRKLYIKPNYGVGRKHHAKDSRGVIRAAMQALEKAKLLSRYNDKSRKDFADDTRPTNDTKLNRRVVSDDGKKTINNIAKEVYEKLIEF